MTMSDYLGMAYPKLAKSLRKQAFASLPTPLSEHVLGQSARKRTVLVKHDEQTSEIYGGNKIRKLEYILQRARDRGAQRVATFGTVGSNHALATAIHAQQFELGCTCFLAHQRCTPSVAKVLRAHLGLGTELIEWGARNNRLALYRRYLQGRNTWVIPLGGSCWLGAVGFVNAGLELAAQLELSRIITPQRIYVANGTMGSVAGLAIGIALARLPIEIHAVRIANNPIARRPVLDKLIAKTAGMLCQIDTSLPADLDKRAQVVWRDDFLAGGYAAVDSATRNAVKVAKEEFDLTLDTTYTGKAMTALLSDLESSAPGSSYLFWNTYNAQPLPTSQSRTGPQLPPEFNRYFD